MSDFGEYIPFDAHVFSGEPASVHNLYPELWAKTNREAVREAGMDGQVSRDGDACLA